MEPRFNPDSYLIRRKVFKLMGAAFHIYDAQGNLVLYSKQKAFKLKEDIRLYASEDMQQELLCIRARQVIDFSAAYEVVDSATGDLIALLRRRGLQSILRDAWVICDAQGNEMGRIEEDSMLLALVRRFVTNLVPQNFTAYLGEQPVADYKQHFNPFIQKMTLDFSKDPLRRFDRRLGIAAAVLLAAIEGRQG
jgi:uncharacterized protein YxjI